jgi:hypothetical protein
MTTVVTALPASLNPELRIKADVAKDQAFKAAALAEKVTELMLRKSKLQDQFEQLDVQWATTNDPQNRDRLGKQRDQVNSDLNTLFQFRQIITNA